MCQIKKIAVIVPFYKQKLTNYENIALKQCFKILNGYPIIAIQPQSLNLENEISDYPFFEIKKFTDDYFADIQGYNRLMLDAIFYREFLKYDYILIYQLDAFVFKDDLIYWCNREIDYVGAPWIRKKSYPNILKKTFSQGLQYFAKRYDVKKNGLPHRKQFDYSVGNGGFSLRKVRVFYDICIQYERKIAAYNQQTAHQYNEDVFWSIEVNRKKKILKIPNYKTALKFAFELAPDQSYQLNQHQLPFGCHAWNLYAEFWRPFFEQAGYEI